MPWDEKQIVSGCHLPDCLWPRTSQSTTWLSSWCSIIDQTVKADQCWTLDRRAWNRNNAVTSHGWYGRQAIADQIPQPWAAKHEEGDSGQRPTIGQDSAIPQIKGRTDRRFVIRARLCQGIAAWGRCWKHKTASAGDRRWAKSAREYQDGWGARFYERKWGTSAEVERLLQRWPCAEPLEQISRAWKQDQKCWEG